METVIRKTLMVALLPLLFACTREEPDMASQGVETSPSRIEPAVTLRVAGDQSEVTPRLANGVLTLGETRLEGWQGRLPQCEQCDLTVARRFKPDGPDTLLSLSRAGTAQWLFFDVRHARAFVDGWAVRWSADTSVTLEKDKQSRSFAMGETTRLAGCDLTLLSVRPLADSSPAGVSSESPRVRIQIEGRCQ